MPVHSSVATHAQTRRLCWLWACYLRLLRYALCALTCDFAHRSLSVVGYLWSRRAAFHFCVLRFAFCALTFFCCLPAAGLVLSAAQAPRGASKTAPPDDRVLRAVVQLVAVGPGEEGQNRECSATGFLIDEEGFLITNAHVVEDANRCLEKAPGAMILAKPATADSRVARAVPCEVVEIDEAHDVALLKTACPFLSEPGERPPFAPLEVHAVAEGTAVMVSGHPEFSWQPVTQTGRIVRVGQAHLAGEDAARSDALELDIPLRLGNSGSPVYRSDGGVIAVVDQRDPLRPSHSVAVSIRYAIALADRHGARWHAVE